MIVTIELNREQRAIVEVELPDDTGLGEDDRMTAVAAVATERAWERASDAAHPLWETGESSAIVRKLRGSG